jgi:hypothetical protein
MESSVKNLPCWFLIAISNIIDSEMNERDAVTKGKSNALTAKGDESIVDGVVPSETTKPHLTIVKNGDSGCH